MLVCVCWQSVEQFAHSSRRSDSGDDSVADTKRSARERAAATRLLPKPAVDYMKVWMMQDNHIEHPYPSEQEKLVRGAEHCVTQGVSLHTTAAPVLE